VNGDKNGERLTQAVERIAAGVKIKW